MLSDRGMNDTIHGMEKQSLYTDVIHTKPHEHLSSRPLKS